MARVTPYYGASGIWELKEPWRTKLGKEYTCTAIRSFVELEIRGMDIYTQVYAPKGLEESIFERDSEEYATLVSIIADDGEIIHVPDTYIIKYPDISVDNYRRFILSCELGTLPGDSQLTHITASVRDVISKYVGRTPNVTIHIADMVPSGLSPSERTREESNRKRAIESNNTLSGQLQQLNKRYGELRTYASNLERRVKENSNEMSLELSNLRSNKTNMSLEISSLKSQINQKDIQIRSQENQISDLNEEIVRLKQEIRNLGG